MKQKISFICIFLILLSKALSKNNLRQVVITKDNAGFQAELSNIVTRNPTISVTHRLDAVPTPQKESNTIEISNKVKDVLFHKGFLYKRLIKACPNVKNDKDYLIELKEEIKNKLNKKTKDKN